MVNFIDMYSKMFGRKVKVELTEVKEVETKVELAEPVLSELENTEAVDEDNELECIADEKETENKPAPKKRASTKKKSEDNE